MANPPSIYKTSKGTELSLINLKGKAYMPVPQRMIWFTEDVERYDIETTFLQMSDRHAVCRAIIKVLDKEGVLLKQVTATKSEDKSGFQDYIEKSETGSIGRALALLGYGTAFALSDLDEGTSRLADSPIETPAPPQSKAPVRVSVTKDGPSAKAPGPSEAQIKRFNAIQARMKFDDAFVAEMMKEFCGKTDVKTLTQNEYNQFCNMMQAGFPK